MCGTRRPRRVSDTRPAGPRHGDGRRAGCLTPIVSRWPPPRAVSDSRPAGPRHGDGRRAGCLTPVVSRWLPSLQPGAWRLDIMQCRFEDRLAGRALSLRGLRQRIEARRPDELPAALEAIEAARHAGRWVALLLDYELGEWLAPETTLPPPGGRPVAPRGEDGAPRLVALVAGHMAREAPWPAPADPGSARIESLQPRMARADYLRQIEAIRALIAAGELYQVNYTQPLDVRVQGDPQQLYRHIAARHPVAHGACIDDGERVVLSFSPELFVRRDGARLTVRPMKGTAPRHADAAEDARLGRELHASP